MHSRLPGRVIAGLIAFETLMVLVHLVVYEMLMMIFGVSGIASTVLAALFVVLALTFVAASIIVRFHKGRLADAFYLFAAYWFGLINFLFVGALLFYIVLVAFWTRGVYVPPALPGAIAFGLSFLIHAYGTWQSHRQEITRVQVKVSDAPGFDTTFWKGKTVVFVSDFQLGNIYREKFVARAVRKISALKPYAVLIGGDLFDGVACDEPRLIAPLATLRPPGGIFFITGNHEYYGPDVAQTIETIKAIGIRVLHNEKAPLGGGVDVVGVDYHDTHARADFKRVIAGIDIDRSRANILLKHEPSDLDLASAAGIVLDLSGHTHHGQIFPLMMFTRQMYKGFDYGLKRFGGRTGAAGDGAAMQIYTSSGIGTWGPPLRLGTKSEIVAMTFI